MRAGNRLAYLDPQLASLRPDVPLAEAPGPHNDDGFAGHEEPLRPGQHDVHQGAHRLALQPGLHRLQHCHVVQTVVGVDVNHHRHDGVFLLRQDQVDACGGKRDMSVQVIQRPDRKVRLSAEPSAPVVGYRANTLMCVP